MPAGRIPFYALSREELASELAAAGFEKFRAKQVFDCVYSKKIFAPKAFPALPAKLAGFLGERFDFEPAKPERRSASARRWAARAGAGFARRRCAGSSAT